jgi:hypothetical protein
VCASSHMVNDGRSNRPRRLGRIATGSWAISLVVGVVIGNGAAYMLRRRAGVPDRSLIGRIRPRR